MHKRVLKFCQISNHKGTTIGKILETCLVEWKIDKVLTISVDNASANKVAIEWLKKKMNSWDKSASVFDGKFMHVRCLAHILNIIVKSGLHILDKSVEAIRNAVKYVRSSPARLACFKSCIEKEKLEPKNDEEEASGMIAEMNDDWERELEKTAEAVEQHEVDKYLLEPVLKPLKENPPNEKKKNFDLLNHWRVNADRFPNLAAVARDVFAIQISTVASEWCFSTGKRVIDPHRSSLSPKSVEALMCLQNWIRSEDIAILEYIPSSEEMEFYEGIEKEHVEEALASKPTRHAKSPRLSEVIN